MHKTEEIRKNYSPQRKTNKSPLSGLTPRTTDHEPRTIPLLCLAFILQIFFATPSQGEPSTYLPVSHRAYDFLELMEHKCQMSGAYLGTKPAVRTEIARLLFGLLNKKDLMTEAEKAELECLLDEFSADYLSRKGFVWENPEPVEKLPGFLKEHLYRNRRNLHSASGDNYSLYFDPVIVRKAELGNLNNSSKKDNVYTSGNGFILRGTLGNHIGFHIDIRDSKEWGSRDYPEQTATTMPGRGYAAFKGDRAEFDETHAHIAWSNGPFVISYGRDRNVWGRGRRGTLLMSSYGAPYDMMKLETGFGRIKFIFFAAEIEQYPPIAKFYYNNPPGVFSDSVTVKKRLSGHRIEINIADRLNLGFHETVVYGGRWDLSYLNPVMFLKGGEHANGDHDNAAMGMDFRLFLQKNHSVYGELLIDDITTTKLGTDWYGNKLAYQIGSFYVVGDMDSRIQYTRLNPWVYTHRYPINSYTHYGDVLGHRAGPNSDEFLLEFRKRFSRRLHTGLSFTRRRHGANTDIENVGGDPLQGFKDGDSKKAKFLAGGLKKTTGVNFDISYELLWQLYVRAGYTYERFRHDGINIFRFSLCLNE